MITFLEEKTKAPVFLEGVKKVISISIEDYIDRNFNNLEINFGCTGGQHRSVYCADQIAMYIKTHYPSVQVNVQHIVQEEKNWINLPY